MEDFTTCEPELREADESKAGAAYASIIDVAAP